MEKEKDRLYSWYEQVKKLQCPLDPQLDCKKCRWFQIDPAMGIYKCRAIFNVR